MGKAQASLRTSDFDYPLPQDLIAQYPTERRGESRLLVVRRRPEGPTVPDPGPATTDSRFGDFADLVNPGDVIVLNTTRVRHARLLGRRPSGAPVEILLLHPDGEGAWIAMGKPGSALRPGKPVLLAEGITLETIEVQEEGYRRVRVIGADAEEVMARFGRLPLPPYIARDPTPLDEQRYQTVFAEREGSVAAPTAGLHFTPELLEAVVNRGATLAWLELEVGPGTFKPVEVEDYASHPMHPERYHIPAATAAAIAAARDRDAAVWAIGTTVVRALESAATGAGLVRPGWGETRLMVTPGYAFRVVNRLLTNFHLPRSTLLMLVAAFAGYEPTMAAYRHAVQAGYRFYSYGDAMAIL
jgi:S-adenosylmethionine:tRNA ribosyltransferase-isomerase